jgi:DNA-binding NarL/FixJ family response regulator
MEGQLLPEPAADQRPEWFEPAPEALHATIQDVSSDAWYGLDAGPHDRYEIEGHGEQEGWPSGSQRNTRRRAGVLRQRSSRDPAARGAPHGSRHGHDDPVRVVVLGNSAITRVGLCSVLQGDGAISVVGEFSCHEEADAIAAAAPDVVVVNALDDAADPGTVVRRLAERDPRWLDRLLVLTHDGPATADPLSRSNPLAKVAGLLLRDVTGRQLVAAVQMIAVGYRVSPSRSPECAGTEAAGAGPGSVPGTLGAMPAPAHAPETRTAVPPPRSASSTPAGQPSRSPAGPPPVGPEHLVELLTRREYDVLRLLAQGNTNAQISQNLVLSESTVKSHVQNVLTKLDVRNRVAAAVYALQVGLVSAEDRP